MSIFDEVKRGIGHVKRELRELTRRVSTIESTLSANSSYLVYTVILSHSGTDAPIVDNLFKNTIGSIIWSRNGVGRYFGTLAGAFTIGKTLCLPFGSATTGFMFQVVSGSIVGYIQITLGANTDRVQIDTYSDLNYTPVEWSAISGSFSFEIRVYP